MVELKERSCDAGIQSASVRSFIILIYFVSKLILTCARTGFQFAFQTIPENGVVLPALSVDRNAITQMINECPPPF